MDGSVALLAVGSLVRRKGYDVLVAALADLKDLPWRLTIAGDRMRSPATAAALDADILHHGLGERIAVLGAVTDDRLAELHANADLFVLPSRHEGYGIAFAEAIAHGLPVIGTTAGAIPDTVPHGAGILVPPDDAAGWRALRRSSATAPSAKARRRRARGRGAPADVASVGRASHTPSRRSMTVFGRSGSRCAALRRDGLQLHGARRGGRRIAGLDPVSIVDLGTGTASGLRALARSRRQTWRLVDQRPEPLGAPPRWAAARVQVRRAGRSRMISRRRSTARSTSSPPRRCSISSRRPGSSGSRSNARRGGCRCTRR
jgi:hypothetical protein